MMNRTTLFLAALTCCAALILSGFARSQDSLQLKDGRVLIGQKMTRSSGGILVHFKNGDVLIRSELIRECTAADALVEAKWTAKEQKKIDRGLVLYEGRWIPTKRRKSLIEAQRQSSIAKIVEVKKHLKWVNRYKHKTKNFQFEFTIDPEIMKGYMELMEAYYKNFTKAWGIKRPSKLPRLRVLFYHDEDYFHQVSAAPAGVIGYYRFVAPRELNFYFDRLDPDMTRDVMFHEANHYLTNLIDLRFNYPAWVNESLAEYYGASEWDPKKKTMTTGRLQEGRLAVIQDAIKTEDWLGLEEMINIKRFASVHYAWGWSFVHFLMQHSKYQKRFKKFYIGLARDSSIKRIPWFRDMKQVAPAEQIKALKRYLGVKDLGKLEQEWRDYVKGLDAVSHRGYYTAGRIALSQGMPIKAQRLFQTAIKMGSKNPMTFYGYGRALSQKGKHSEAIAQFQKAIEADPLSGMFYVRLADAMRRDDDDSNEEAQRYYRLALEIEPNNYSVLLNASEGIEEN